MITDLDFADDYVIFTEMMDGLVGTLDTLSTESVLLGEKVSYIKTKIQRFDAFFGESIYLLLPVTVKGEHISFVDNFLYLWSDISSAG